MKYNFLAIITYHLMCSVALRMELTCLHFIFIAGPLAPPPNSQLSYSK